MPGFKCTAYARTHTLTNFPLCVLSCAEMSDPVPECGIEDTLPEERIVNGQETAPHSNPWMVAIEVIIIYIYVCITCKYNMSAVAQEVQRSSWNQKVPGSIPGSS